MNNAQWLGLIMLILATGIGLADLALLMWQAERQRAAVRSPVQPPCRTRRLRAHR